jgi:hypothetical protein
MSTRKLAAEAREALVEAIADLMERSAPPDGDSREPTERRFRFAPRRSSSHEGAGPD